MFHRPRLVAAAVGMAAALALPSAASAAGSTSLTCTGAVAGGTYAGVTVPSGAFCSLTDVTVLGNVAVQADASLTTSATGADAPLATSPMTIRGNLTVSGTNAFADIGSGTVIGGTTTLVNANAVQISNATVHGIVARNSQDVYLAGSDVYGSVLVDHPHNSGNLSLNEFITGNVVLNAAAAGDDPDFPNSWYIEGPQTIGGNVVLTNNRAFTDVDSNTIKGSLSCLGNDPAPVTFANQVAGPSLGQCATPTGP